MTILRHVFISTDEAKSLYTSVFVYRFYLFPGLALLRYISCKKKFSGPCTKLPIAICQTSCVIRDIFIHTSLRHWLANDDIRLVSVKSWWLHMGFVKTFRKSRFSFQTLFSEPFFWAWEWESIRKNYVIWLIRIPSL